MHTNSILQKPVKAVYRQYLMPTLIALLCNSMYCLADVFFVAQGSGRLGLAALNIAMPIFAIFAAIGMSIGVGGATIMAIAEGNHQHTLRNQAFSISIFAMVAIGLICSVVGVVFLNPIAYAFGSSEQLMPYVRDYLLPIMLCAFIFIPMYPASIIMRSDHAPKMAMTATIIGNVTNIILDYFFVIVFKQGIIGAAVATCIGSALTLLFMFPHFLLHRNTVHFTKNIWDKVLFLRILRNGIGSGLLEISAGVMIVLFNIVILRYADAVFLAAFAIVTNIAYVSRGLLNGFAQAAQPIISVNHGARQSGRVKEALHISLWYGIGFAGFVYLVFLLFPQQTAALFSNGDQVLISKAAEGIRIYFSSLLFSAAITMIMYYFQSIERGHIATLLAICKGFIFVILGLVILMFLFGIQGIWLTIPFAEACAALLGVYFLRKTGTMEE